MDLGNSFDDFFHPFALVNADEIRFQGVFNIAQEKWLLL